MTKYNSLEELEETGLQEDKSGYAQPLTFQQATWVINTCVLKGLSIMVIGPNGIGKTELATVIWKEFKDVVIPISAIDMGGLVVKLGKKGTEDKTHLMIADLKAFFRNSYSRQKLISYLVSMMSDSEFEDLSYNSEVKQRDNPLQVILFGTERHLMSLFREVEYDLLDRFLVIFVDRQADDVIRNVKRNIPYSLEITPIHKIEREMSYDIAEKLIPTYENMSPRKVHQLYELHKGLLEIGFTGSIPIFNCHSPPDESKNYYVREWRKSPVTVTCEPR